MAAANEHVDVALSNAFGAAAAIDAAASTCDNVGANTNASGQCTIVFTSPTAGQVTGNASASLNLAGVVVSRQTAGNAGVGGSGQAVKTFVDARIHIEQSGTNKVGNPHTFTVSTLKNAG